MPKKTPPIKYSSRTFETIRDDLIEYAKRYYPDTFKDFNEASFGMMSLENTAYIGDILSFYADYQANESFFDSAVEYNNIVRHARSLGYRLNSNPSSHGLLSFYILVPANTSGLGPMDSLKPILRRGSEFSTIGGNTFLLVEDVDFSKSTNEVVVARVNETTGVPSAYAVKAFGRAISGRLVRKTFTVGEFERFRKIEIGSPNVAEVISVVDDEGHEYIEVKHLSQDVVFQPVLNRNDDSETVPSILKPVPTPRRFVLERERGKVYLQFGYGTDSELVTTSIAEPNQVVLNVHGRDFISDTTFDPTKILSTDKFGIAPANTTLTVVYRLNTNNAVNASVGSISEVSRPTWKFTNLASLTQGDVDFVVESIEVTNEEAFVGDVSLPSSEELKIRAKNFFATQDRAVTEQDYKSLSYAMPSQFGSIKRVHTIQDSDSFKRNLNLYVISENSDGELITANTTLKENLKVWINNHKMVNDTIDILDAKIINFGIEFQVIAEPDKNRFDVLQTAIAALRDEFLQHFDIAEPILISRIYSVLNGVEGVEDTTDVRIVRKSGSQYATTRFDPDASITADGRMITAYENTVYELKFPSDDIEGSIA